MSAFPPTLRQRDLLQFIEGYLCAHGYSPSIEEMREGLGLSARSGIIRMLDGLEERGHIRRLRNRARAIEVLEPVAIPLAPDGAPLYAVPGFGE